MIGQFADAAELAQAAGFHFVDLKHCHGYLGHEFLSAYTRPGPYGGSFENRTRFLRELVSAIRSRCPGLRLAVRLSVFDMPPLISILKPRLASPSRSLTITVTGSAPTRRTRGKLTWQSRLVFWHCARTSESRWSTSPPAVPITIPTSSARLTSRLRMATCPLKTPLPG